MGVLTRNNVRIVGNPMGRSVVFAHGFGDYVHESIPGSTLVHLASAGHLPSLAAPEPLARAILAYLT